MLRFFALGGGYGFGMTLGRHPEVGHRWLKPRHSDGAESRGERYERAYKVYLVIQHLYDRWADEVFRAQRAL